MSKANDLAKSYTDPEIDAEILALQSQIDSNNTTLELTALILVALRPFTLAKTGRAVVLTANGFTTTFPDDSITYNSSVPPTHQPLVDSEYYFTIRPITVGKTAIYGKLRAGSGSVIVTLYSVDASGNLTNTTEWPGFTVPYISRA